MKEIKGNIFDYLKDADTDAICIFTNGIVNKYGQAMAGAGQAGAAAQRWLNFRNSLGNHLNKNGNIVGALGSVSFSKTNEMGKTSFFKCHDGSAEMYEETMLAEVKQDTITIVSFPTKKHFANPAIPELIVKSAKDLVEMSNKMRFRKIIMGAPGCGTNTGRLSWEKDVKPLISGILDDRFVVVQNG